MTFFAVLGVVSWCFWWYQFGYCLAEFLEAKDRLLWLLQPVERQISEVAALLTVLPPRALDEFAGRDVKHP